jgi:hypothetical protein
MEDSDKENRILTELKRRAEDIRYGCVTVEFKIQDGKILQGEIIQQRIKLG